ncbi:hypothetical protein QQS21_003757 [Conoideocrella luteorostrata]|uniref:Sister chromatid cohesion protein DCC1 n=1 Tax=Conoideocrella luteorostrata TaxID=1105319 RepID=A0AAJ0CVM6_9HYPO|nr:hypothetical protein QQS21_003757 [Conoideocrella luteorostrata]
MSSQNQGLKLIHQPDDSGYRLLELPPDLANLLESDAAPVLTLESSDDSAILRTPDKAYHLRQKNTSNALLLLSPKSSPDSADQELAIISTIHETVELDVMPELPVRADKLADTGSRGKWHEMFGKGR